MYITRVKLKNWRNFRQVDVRLQARTFLVGPNASGKSNFLDVFRFLQDLVKAGGGLQSALRERGGLTKIRCLAARNDPEVMIEVELGENPNESQSIPDWRYRLVIVQDSRGTHEQHIKSEEVWKAGERILNRPDAHDRSDPLRRTQTHLEQISANVDFRDISKHFSEIRYLHLIPQLLRHLGQFEASSGIADRYGSNLLQRILQCPEQRRKSRLTKINSVLKLAVPQFQDLHLITDQAGRPHLEIKYEHWRPNGAMQREDQFSDGTLRLIGLLWSLLDGTSVLLLEEPELSLHGAIVSRLPSSISRLLRSRKSKSRQVIISTHSSDMLNDPEISANEILLLEPKEESTQMCVADSVKTIKHAMEAGLTAADVVLPRTVSNSLRDSRQKLLFE